MDSLSHRERGFRPPLPMGLKAASCCLWHSNRSSSYHGKILRREDGDSVNQCRPKGRGLNSSALNPRVARACTLAKKHTTFLHYLTLQELRFRPPQNSPLRKGPVPLFSALPPSCRSTRHRCGAASLSFTQARNSPITNGFATKATPCGHRSAELPVMQMNLAPGFVSRMRRIS